MKRFFSIMVFAFIPLCAISAEAPAAPSLAALVGAGHWIYDALSVLSLETGSATLAVNAPASRGELRVCLDAVPYDSLSATGRALYRRSESFLAGSEPLWQSGAAALDIRPSISVSARYRLTGGDGEQDYDSLGRFNETPPLLSFPLAVGFSPFVSAFADFSVGEGYWASGLEDNYTNVPASADAFDLNVPSTAHVSAGNGFVTAVIGRGSLGMGRTLSGSMILSDTADRLDYASLVFFSPAIRMSLTPVELAPDRFVYYHDISIRPLSWMTLRFSEAASVNSTVDLRYLNPAMIFHSLAGWRDDYGEAPGDDSSPVGTQFAFSADLVPARGLRLYGQFAMNQFQTSFELENSAGASVIPNAMGGLAGAEYARPRGDGYLTAAVEGVYTNPWLYILSNHDISFYWSRRELVAPSGYPSRDIRGWLGTPFGPDAIAVLAKVKYEVPFSYRVGLGYRFVCRGASGRDFLASDGDQYYPGSVAEAKRNTPTGAVSYQNRVRVELSRTLSERLEIGADLDYSLLTGRETGQSFRTVLTAAYALR